MKITNKIMMRKFLFISLAMLPSISPCIARVTFYPVSSTKTEVVIRLAGEIEASSSTPDADSNVYCSGGEHTEFPSWFERHFPKIRLAQRVETINSGMVDSDFVRVRVILQIAGGRTCVGKEFAKQFYKFGFSTYVRSGDTCYSACAIAFLGGTEPANLSGHSYERSLVLSKEAHHRVPARVLEQGGTLMFHAPRISPTIISEKIVRLARKRITFEQCKNQTDSCIKALAKVSGTISANSFDDGVERIQALMELADQSIVPRAFVRTFLSFKKENYYVCELGRARFAGIQVKWPISKIPKDRNNLDVDELTKRSCSSIMIYDILAPLVLLSDVSEFLPLFAGADVVGLKKKYSEIVDAASPPARLKNGLIKRTFPLRFQNIIKTYTCYVHQSSKKVSFDLDAATNKYMDASIFVTRDNSSIQIVENTPWIAIPKTIRQHFRDIHLYLSVDPFTPIFSETPDGSVNLCR